MMTNKAIVIGSGFGGLAVAIRLQSAGYQTTLIEARDKPGGRAYVYQDKGFTFDAGPTVITAPDCLEELFSLSNRRMDDYVKMVPVTPFYRLSWGDGVSFDYSNDSEKLREQIMKLNPEDWEGYQQFMAYSRDVFREGYEKLAAVPFLKIWDMVKVAPQLMKLSAYRSVYSMVSKYIKNEHLRQAFSFHALLVGGNPFSSSSIYTLIHYLERNWGVHFPLGGTGALVQGLVRLFEDLGGDVLLNTPVEEILTKKGRVFGVQLKNKVQVAANIVVSNADVHYTYNHLLKKSSVVSSTSRKLDHSRYSMSLFLIYFGLKGKYPHLAHHNVIFGPRYKELLKDIFDRGVLADDFSLYLHMPSVTDPSLAPENCSSFYVLSPVPHLGKMPSDWSDIGPKYADRILDFLEKNYIPNLKENLVTQSIFTPQDFKTELNAHLGSAFSLEPILTQSAYFRAHNRDKHLKGMYIVGAGTHPGAGVPGVVNSAKATFNVIAEDFPNWQLATPDPVVKFRDVLASQSGDLAFE